DFHTLEVFYAAGLRSLGLTWSRHNRFGFGVPFAYPATPDFGGSLSDLGKVLVQACDTLGIMLDVSHLNEKGFDDLARLSHKPIVATHSNSHALTPHARNLTDRQLDIIRDSDGLVGLNFATAMLRPDGCMNPKTDFDPVLRHLDYLLEYLGEDRVGFGSDFDGTTIPNVIGDCAGVLHLSDILLQHGIGGTLLLKLYHQNWLRILRHAWHEA
ncbi:MAG: membrane dipeptidase, partial [Alphaproteobacteria bacterium]|nr:membrane dipeptidase [Alphaproteobacteria bacterium]